MVQDVINNHGPLGLSPQEYLAGVIQGEAGSPDGQFAVASVIQNRANSGSYPSSPVDVASQGAGTKVPQFSGYNPKYSDKAYELAGALLKGSLPSYGDTGNAMFYNAKGNNSAYDGGGAVIGGNSYSDQFGKAPSDKFRAPVYNGASTGMSAPPPSNIPAIPAFLKSSPLLSGDSGMPASTAAPMQTSLIPQFGLATPPPQSPSVASAPPDAISKQMSQMAFDANAAKVRQQAMEAYTRLFGKAT